MARATLVFDDDCGFCTWCADAVAARSTVRTVGFSELTDEQRDRLPADYESCSHLLVDGETYSCGASIEAALVRVDGGEALRPVVRFLRQFEEYPRLRERAYRLAADNRDRLGRVVSKTPPARPSDDPDDDARDR